MARMPSPPGRFSTTTGCFHKADSLSAKSLAPMSTPLPAPSVTMNRTGRVGQSAAFADAPSRSEPTNNAATNANAANPRLRMTNPPLFRQYSLVILLSPGCSRLVHASASAMIGHCCGVAGPDALETPMPPIFVSPLVKWTLVVIGGAIVVHWVVTEFRRVNEELDALRARVRIRDQEP